MSRRGRAALRVEARGRRLPALEHIGVVMAVVVFLCAGASVALQAPLFVSRDERAHLGYAHAIASGRLPQIEDWSEVPADATRWQRSMDNAKDDRYRTIWVANHPPLHYVLVAPLVWVATATGRADGGLVYLRLANVALASLGIVFTYLLTVQVTGGSRRLGLAAAAIVAVLPRAHYDLSLALNDGLALAAATAVAWAAVRVLRHGHTPAGLALVGATAAVAAGARSATLLVAAAVSLVLTVDRFVNTAGRLRSRLRAASMTALLALGPAVVLFGWFYVRNVVLYGDMGGSGYLMERFDRQRQGGFFGTFTSGDLWVHLYQGFTNWSIFSIRTEPPGTIVSGAAAVVAGVGLIALVVSRLPRWRWRWPSSPRVSLRALALCAVVVLAIAATITQHVAAGGSTFPRYALPAIGTLACLLVIGLDAVVPRVLPVLAFAVLAGWAAHFLPTRVGSEMARGNGPEPSDLGGGGVILLVVALTSTVALLSILVWTALPRRGERSGAEDR